MMLAISTWFSLETWKGEEDLKKIFGDVLKGQRDAESRALESIKGEYVGNLG
jgi:hypothetical protein